MEISRSRFKPFSFAGIYRIRVEMLHAHGDGGGGGVCSVRMIVRSYCGAHLLARARARVSLST